jgi:hypothetical protein
MKLDDANTVHRRLIMFEFHGWFVVAETPEDQDEGGLDQILADLRRLLPTLEWPSGMFDLRPLNGQYVLSIAGNPNRPRRYHQDLDELVLFLARRTPGSYGLLYWRDDEDASPPGYGNVHVRVLARGTVSDQFDPFLSPTIPVIEHG